ncbi:MAG: putative Rossmann fold flavoprotein, partial [Paracoccaceae bacterium]
AVKVLADFKQAKGTRSAANALAEIMPKRLAALVASHAPAGKNLADMSVQEMSDLAGRMSNWQLTPAGSEGYRTAEVTIGGVSTDVLNSKTMQARDVPGLYFIGEVVDVTGWLGGYNFQWAWSSGWAAGQAA